MRKHPMPNVVANDGILNQEQTGRIVEQFYCDGVALVPGVLKPDEVAALRDRADEIMSDQCLEGTESLTTVGSAIVLRFAHLHDNIFADLLTHPLLLGLVETILGPRPVVCGQNVLRGRKGESVFFWHVDEVVEFPLPDDIPRHDARLRMPVLWLTVQIALTDIDVIEHGPTQIVRGSHYSGRAPGPDAERPVFEGRGPEPIFCKAGDAYLFNHQVWHRGAPNLSDRTRYLAQNQYCRRWASSVFARPELARRLPEQLSRHADNRLLDLLGKKRP